MRFFKNYKRDVASMTIEKPKFEYSVKSTDIKPVPVIIVAAGNSSRMGGVNKQTVMLSGMPVIARTLLAFERSPYINKIILVTKKEDILKFESICEEYSVNKVTDIIEGGEDRHSSVLNGIDRLSENDESVLIHDGARPFVSDTIICDCVNALKEYDGVLPVVKVSDTVKEATENGIVSKTVDRSCLYLAQTPQGVNIQKYKVAGNNAGDFTDDASVLENAGYKVKTVLGDKKNIKITTPDDIIIAKAFIDGGLV